MDSVTRVDVAEPVATTADAALVLCEDGGWYMGNVRAGSGALWPAELEVYGARIRWKSHAIEAFFQSQHRGLGALRELSESEWDPRDALAQIAASSPGATPQ